MPEPASLIGQTVSHYRIVVSEQEKLYITSHYADYVTRNAEASRSVYELWAQTYPRNDVPPTKSVRAVPGYGRIRQVSGCRGGGHAPQCRGHQPRQSVPCLL